MRLFDEDNLILGCSFIVLSLIGVIIGTVLSILQATGEWNIGWFWAVFPFWIVPVSFFGLMFVLLLLCFLISVAAHLFREMKNFHDYKGRR